MSKKIFHKGKLKQDLIVKLHNKDVVLQFKKPKSKAKSVRKNTCRNTRGNINYFSYHSRRRMKLFARNTSHLWKVFVHLTYPRDYPSDGKKVKKHLDVFIKRLRRRYPDIKYLWVIEFQQRGAPHFHIVVNQEIDKNWLSQNWYEVVGSGDERHLRAGTKIELVRSKTHAIAYLMKYLGKLDQKTVPEEYKNVGRFWSHSSKILEVNEYTIEDTLRNNKRNTRAFRRWYRAKLRSWGYYKWKWKGEGFTAWEGMAFFNELKKRGLPNDLTSYF